MKQVLEEMVSKPNVQLVSVTKKYFFKHVTQKERKLGRDGDVSPTASLFRATAIQTKLKADYYYFGEDGTGVEVTEVVES